ncbi:phytanoyl-CoA dioxygenase family protein [Paraburkholderia sp. BR14263]|uniref:phytanoyl-CoA dioxygenase family protein n=1 Tax=unclassified Paraburkholderia TaxID=2615204 RepID=UPI0034CD9ED7
MDTHFESEKVKMAILKRMNVLDPASAINEILEEDGCVVIDGLLSSDEICQVQAEMASGFESVQMCRGGFYGPSTKRISGVINKSSMSRTMAVHPLILEVMDHHLLKSCRQYQLNLTQAIQICPGEIAQFIHSDDLMFPFAHPGSQAMINCMWAIDEFTETNGATQVVPGSHRWPIDRQPEEYEIAAGAMPAGSVLIYFGGLLHGGGANKSNASRTGLVLSYCLGWLRQGENHYLSIPLEQIKHFPLRLQQLLGYFVHEPNLGCVGGQDPILLANGEYVANDRFEEFLPSEAIQLIEEYRCSQSISASNVPIVDRGKLEKALKS